MPDHKELHTIKYMQIAREIEAEIRKYRIHPGSPVYSVRDIIRRWHVSSESAQNVLKFLEQRDIIFRVPRKGCFVKARGKSKKESRNFKVGCCIYNTETDFKLDHLIKLPELELVDILEKNHCTLKYLDKMIFHDPASVHRELNGLDGLIVSAVPVKLTECKALADLKIPAVAIHGDILFDFPIHQVLPDPMTGLRAMFQEAKRFHVDHVITVTHNHPNGLTRAAACRKAAEEYGIRDISSVVLPLRRGEYNAAMKLAPALKNTLIFTCSCTIAFPFLNAFSDTKKLSPSKDYHLVCYDDIESIGIMPKPAPVMTTIGYSHKKLIQNAAKILLDEMNEPSGCIKKILIPTSLTIRGSGLCDTDAEQNRGKQKKF